MPSVLGTVRLKEGGKRTRTGGQVLFSNTFDSRLAQTTTNYLDPKRIRAIRTDPTIMLAKQVVVSPMVHTPWEYIEVRNAPKGATDMISDNFEPERDWLIQNAIFGALDFGWAPFEVVYKIEDGNTKVKEFKQLLQDFTQVLVYLDTGRFAGFTNEPLNLDIEDSAAIVPIPYALNINLMYEGTDYYGISVSSIINSTSLDWDDTSSSANRYDKKVAGATWVVYYPVGVTPLNGVNTDNDEIAKKLMLQLEASGAIAIPDEIQEFLDDTIEREMKGKWRIELISAEGSQAANFVDRHKYLDNLKIRAFGIPERSILEAKFGTKADAESHGDIALMTINTKHKLFCDQLNKYVVAPLMTFQYGEKYANSVCIKPSPLVDAQFQTVKEIYRLLIQTPSVLEREIENIDVQSLRSQVGIPSVPGAGNIEGIERTNGAERTNSEEGGGSENGGSENGGSENVSEN